ncbi:MAG: uroporphyrinogen-III synthase, partial [Candidatus Omnitrophota bacterium]
GTLSTIVKKVKASGMKAPAIIVIGHVVNLRQQLDWFKPERPLQGKRILVTRPKHQVSVLADLLQRQGAVVTAIPLITIIPSKDTAGIKAALKTIDRYDWIVLTSVNGVDFFLKALERHKIGLDRLKGRKFAAIGKKTAEHLEAAGITVDLTPKEFVQEGLADAMISKIAASRGRVLLPHASGSRTVLEQRLREAGLNVDTLDLYSARPLTANHRRVKKMFDDRKVDAVMLTSSSCAESFINVFDVARLKKDVGDVVLASIGPITSATLCRAGLNAAVESRESTIEGVVNALTGHYRQYQKDAA